MEYYIYIILINKFLAKIYKLTKPLTKFEKCVKIQIYLLIHSKNIT